MNIYAIADLHLSEKVDKPMGVFGYRWQDHDKKIIKNWLEIVKDDDIVLIPGDISWALKLKDAEDDLKLIGELPGRKILLKGNHDLWWSSMTKVNTILPSSITLLQNNSIDLNGITICGTRGWSLEGETGNTKASNEKVFRREVQRLRLSLESAVDAKRIIVMFHFPPFGILDSEEQFINVLKEYPVSDVVYGHLHGEITKFAKTGEIEGINYHLVSCDSLDFIPLLIY